MATGSSVQSDELSPLAKRIKREPSINNEEDYAGSFEDDLAMMQVSRNRHPASMSM